MYIAYAMILASILPMPIVYLLRRFQILQVDLDIHQGSIRRNETTASTKEMIDEDDVSVEKKCIIMLFYLFKKIDWVGFSNIHDIINLYVKKNQGT